MTVLCCGDREWPMHHQVPIIHELRRLGPGTVIVHGAARGADTLCGIIAQAYGYDVKAYPADWELYGKAAGPVRNKAMLRMHPEIALVLAFHDALHTSKGTADMIARALHAGILCRHVTSAGTSTLFPPQPKLISPRFTRGRISRQHPDCEPSRLVGSRGRNAEREIP